MAVNYNKNWQTFSFIFVHYVAGRFQIFQQNLKLIEQRNKKGTENHGINKYADIHVREFNRQTKGYKPRRRSTQEIAKRSIYLDFGHINNTLATTKAIDWRSKGAVSAVKNQGQCGSCCRLNLFFDFSTAARFDIVWHCSHFFLFCNKPPHWYTNNPASLHLFYLLLPGLTVSLLLSILIILFYEFPQCFSK